MISHSPLQLLGLITIFILQLPPSAISNLELYRACKRQFKCGNLSAGYPFWGWGGGERPRECGHPRLELRCDNHEKAPFLSMNGLRYRLLEVNGARGVARIARQDLLDGVCSREVRLENTTLLPQLSVASASAYINLTLLYGCPPAEAEQLSLWGRFRCGPGPGDCLVVQGAVGAGTCRGSATVVVPAAYLVGRPADVGRQLGAALRGGFEVEWEWGKRACERCTEREGVCGFDESLNQTICYCPPPSRPGPDLGTCTTLSLPPAAATPPQITRTTVLQCTMLLVLAAVLLLSRCHASTSPSSRPSPFFPNCSQSFSCGSLRNISYPFSGGSRPAYCGLPGFRLRCTDDSFPELLTDTLTFRILELDPVLQRMTLSRSDLYSNPCPHRFINTTLNPAIFDPYGPEWDNVNLTLLYGCSYQPVDSFSCSDDDDGGMGMSGFYLVGVLGDPFALGCNVSVTVPLSRIIAADLKTNHSSIGEVLMKGFGVSYRNPAAAECRKCLHSGGHCGFSGGPICICGYTLCDKSTDSKTQTLGLGLGVGGAAIATVLLCGLCLLMIHRKRMSRAAEISRDLLPTMSSTITKTSKTPNSLNDLSLDTNRIPADTTNGSTYFGAHVFPYSELEEATDKFNPSKELGDGGFGTVYFGMLSDGREVAVKRLYENNFRRVEQFMNEVEILTRLRHPNLVALYGCTSRHCRELLLVYEYIPNGTLADHLHGKLRASNSSLPWSVRLSIAVETANALAYLHASDTIHRDVKSTNILLDDDFHVKVADFGLSRLFPDDVTHVSTAPQGTPGYVDPEYYQIYQLTSKSDVYSFGVVLMELISAKPAVDTGRHRHDINLATMAIKRIQNHALHELIDPSLSLGFEKNDFGVKRMVTSVAELAFRCLQMQSEARPSMEEVLETLKEIRNDQAEVVDIDMVLVKQMSPPLSPDTDIKWAQTRTF